jgi:hypothetical protein
MVKRNTYIIRTISILLYLVVISILVFLVSSLYSYLNTGADRSKILHTEVQKVDQYLPKVTWKEDGNEGRFMDDQTLKSVENDYLDSWYVKHIANKTNTITGIEDFYTKNARENLYNFIDYNKKENIKILSTTIEHHPDILFFSEDGQLIVLQDKNVIEYKRIEKDGKLILETTEVSDYKIILLLEDGFWRVRHIVKESGADFKNEAHLINTDSLDIKGINYYPQKTPWNMFGDEFDAEIIKKDFDIIKEANLNTIRVFVPYEDFGKANLNESKLNQLEELLDLAELKNLKVVLTLFDFYGNYDVLDWTLNHRHAEKIVTKFKNHSAILAWDIKNEPDLDFESRGKEKVIAWLKSLSILIKSIDANHAVTIGWSNTKSASILKDDVDFVSFHYYEGKEKFEAELHQLQTEMPDKKLVLGEFGVSSYGGFWRPFSSSEENQETYYREMQKVLTKKNISFMSWTLYDFNTVPKKVVGNLPWRVIPQKQFGFINEAGSKKPSFKHISR